MSDLNENLLLLKTLHLCCPGCKGQLQRSAKAYSCAVCKKVFPIMHGIPDFRLFGDPYLGFKDDYARTQLISENMNRFDFAGLLKFYWSNSPETPDSLRSKFVRTALLGDSKAKEILKSLPQSETDKHKTILEIGCGTGGFLSIASKRYKRIVAIDIALRWLIVCSKRLKNVEARIPLICCCAEFLPFPDNYFDMIVSSATIEHTRSQKSVFNESYRVLKQNGVMFVSAPNRFSLSMEPHVYLWGVGFLPRRWMGLYVKLFKGVEYKNKRLASYFELKRLFHKFKCVKFSFPDIDDESVKQFGALERLQAVVYRKMRLLRIFRLFLLLFGPVYHVCGWKHSQKSYQK